MTELTIRHAIEKVAFRLGLLGSGHVPLARLLLELPLTIDILNNETHEIADGRSMLRNGIGEYSALHFPEFAEASNLEHPDTCPICAVSTPKPLYEGQRIVATPVTCDLCYKQLAVITKHTLQSTISKIRRFFGSSPSDPFKDLRCEHDIIFKALKCGGMNLTHTTIATQTAFTIAEVSDKLRYMGTMRIAKFGLTVSGDAVAYSFPEGLEYPRPLYQRFKNALSLALADQRSTLTTLGSKKTLGTSSNRATAQQSNTRDSIQSTIRPRQTPSTSSFKIVVKSKEQAASDTGRVKIRLKPSTRMIRQDASPPSDPSPVSAPPVVDDGVDSDFVDDLSKLQTTTTQQEFSEGSEFDSGELIQVISDESHQSSQGTNSATETPSESKIPDVEVIEGNEVVMDVEDGLQSGEDVQPDDDKPALGFSSGDTFGTLVD